MLCESVNFSRRRLLVGQIVVAAVQECGKKVDAMWQELQYFMCS